MENTSKKERKFELDLIRCFALFSVIAVHFFLNTGFYNEIIVGKSFYLMTLIRSFFMVCVPLFIILTGYLKNKKSLSKKYYLGIVKIIAIYLIVSIICLIFKRVYLLEEISFKTAIKQILNFSAAPYSWYVEMYIGLFLLIPFLNLIFNNLKNQKEAKC